MIGRYKSPTTVIHCEFIFIMFLILFEFISPLNEHCLFFCVLATCIISSFLFLLKPIVFTISHLQKIMVLPWLVSMYELYATIIFSMNTINYFTTVNYSFLTGCYFEDQKIDKQHVNITFREICSVPHKHFPHLVWRTFNGYILNC